MGAGGPKARAYADPSKIRIDLRACRRSVILSPQLINENVIPGSSSAGGFGSPASTDDRVAVGAACVARAAGEPRAHTAGLVAAPAIGVGTRVTARGKRRLGCHRGTRGRRPACWHSCARWDPAAVGPTARPGGWCCLGRRCGGSGSSRCAPGHGARARGATQASSEPPTPRSGHCSEAGTDPGRVAPVPRCPPSRDAVR